MSEGKYHELSEADVEWALSEVVFIDHIIASGAAREGLVKRLSYNPHTRTFRVKTNTTEATFGTAAEAARWYSGK